MKKIELYSWICLFLIFSSYDVYSLPIVYSEKFRINTEHESNIISIPIKIRNINNLYAFEMSVSYDNSNLIQYNNITPGTFLQQGNAQLFNGKDMNMLSTSSGRISRIVISRKATNSSVSGNGDLVFFKI
ncbi:MAG: cohesin domain-containing protein [archaeon]